MFPIENGDIHSSLLAVSLPGFVTIENLNRFKA